MEEISPEERNTIETALLLILSLLIPSKEQIDPSEMKEAISLILNWADEVQKKLSNLDDIEQSDVTIDDKRTFSCSNRYDTLSMILKEVNQICLPNNNITEEMIIKFIYSQTIPSIDIGQRGLKSIFYENNNHPIYVKNTHIQTSCIDLVSKLVSKKLKDLCKESVYPAAVALLVSNGGLYDPYDIKRALKITFDHANKIYEKLPNDKKKEEEIGGFAR